MRMKYLKGVLIITGETSYINSELFLCELRPTCTTMKTMFILVI